MVILPIHSRRARLGLAAGVLIAAIAAPAATALVPTGGAGAGGASLTSSQPPSTSESSGCADTNAPATGPDAARLRQAVICLANQQRHVRGLPALVEDSRLDRSAQAWTETMIKTDAFTHGTDFAARITSVGFDWSAAGENIATGFTTPHQVVDAWMASLGHCRNILDPNFSRIGVGLVAKPVAGYASGPATWTQDFGLPAGAQPPSHDTRPMNGCPYTVGH